ncbi:hypothetical protein [Nocardiopsis sp. B62]|uniref:hypothetical protein n=1 Tax=Nocardiopsis sp. B62 TaxID=2824874 RepID=UPI001B370A99|nr:hypothetical protein [Nocardiopsis sp. B62]MBQ1081460.1 hypothetical protein [Nocardiopsis sp. B62]
MPRPDHEDESEARGEDPEERGRRKRIDLSVAQVAGAGVATLTAATAASYLNVYGTVIGTGVMAVLSTSAAPIIQHWITRSGEQAKGLAEKKAAQHTVARSLVDTDAEARTDEQLSGFETAESGQAGIGQTGFGTTGAAPGTTGVADTGFPGAFDLPEDDDATRTMAMPTVGRDLPGQTIAHGFGNPEDPTLLSGPTEVGATELIPSVGGRTGRLAAAADDEGADDESGADRPKRGWRAVAISAAAVFTLVMLVILTFELMTGRSLTAWTQGQDEPTSPSLFGGHSAPAQVEEDTSETPETDGGDQPTDEGDTGTQLPETEQPVGPETDTPPVETEPEAPGGGQTDPTGPPVDGGEPEEPGGGEAPDPGSRPQPEGEPAPEPATTPVG